MTKRTIFGVIALAMIGVSAGLMPFPEKGTYTLDTEKSSLEWTGKKVTGQHFGKVDLKKGSFKVENGTPVSGKVMVDMTTIENHDLQDEKHKKKLEGHLRSPDFFNVEEHPTSSFNLKKIKKMKKEDKVGNTHEVSGDLTIKGITNDITFPARIHVEGEKLAAYADFEIDRTRWKVKYGSSKFFDDLGDKMIYDDINLKVKVLAKKK